MRLLWLACRLHIYELKLSCAEEAEYYDQLGKLLSTSLRRLTFSTIPGKSVLPILWVLDLTFPTIPILWVLDLQGILSTLTGHSMRLTFANLFCD